MQFQQKLSQNERQMVSKTAISNNTDAITAETLARTTADGPPNTAISNNTDATAEATTRADAISEALARTTADGVQNTAISTIRMQFQQKL
jgi:hypothetical protein